MESIELPRTLPLLPLHGQVLLPTAFVRVQVSRKALRRCVYMPLLLLIDVCSPYGLSRAASWCSVALLEHLSAQSARELLVAVVPSLAPKDARQVTFCLSCSTQALHGRALQTRCL